MLVLWILINIWDMYFPICILKMICFLQISAWVRVWREYMYNRHVLKFYKMCFKNSYDSKLYAVLCSLYEIISVFTCKRWSCGGKEIMKGEKGMCGGGEKWSGIEGGTVSWGWESAYIEDLSKLMHHCPKWSEIRWRQSTHASMDYY